MFWSKKRPSSFDILLKEKAKLLPWYRSPNYKGNLTEEEKRELDSFRIREERDEQEHPAASSDDLPHEVNMYISKLQLERYDKIQQSLFTSCFVLSAIGVFVLLNYFVVVAGI
jgi:hypothetical protein